MAQPALVVDASVVVKWFLVEKEQGVTQAVSLLNQIAEGEILAYAPDLVCFEVLNALVHKKSISLEQLRQANVDLFNVGLFFVPASTEMMIDSVRIARQQNITVYDACYIALAIKNGCPLVTANSRQSQSPDCQIIAIEKWRM